MQLVIDIKNESLTDKIIKILEVFKNDGVEIIKNFDNEKSNKLDDEYIEKNWLNIIRKAHIPDGYEKSEQYIEDRVKDWEERRKI